MTKIGQSDILAMLASELDDAQAQLEKLGSALVAHPDTAEAHVQELQALDHIGQRCASVAAILRSADLQAASHAAALESITQRLGLSSGARGTPASGDVTWFS